MGSLSFEIPASRAPRAIMPVGLVALDRLLERARIASKPKPGDDVTVTTGPRAYAAGGPRRSQGEALQSHVDPLSK